MGGQSSKSENAQQVGNMKIYFTEGEYLPGEIIKGQVILSLSQEMYCSSIILRFKSSEQLTYKHTQHKPTTMLNQQAQVIQLRKKLNQGDHSFNFQYQLPTTLEPSTHINKNQQKAIETKEVMFTQMYMMVGELKIEDINFLDIQAMNVIKIRTKCNQKVIFLNFSQNLRGMFCINYGVYNQNIEIRQDEFNPGSNIQIALVLSNEGKLPLEVFRFELMREYEFKKKKFNNKIKQLSIGRQYQSIGLAPYKSTDKLRLDLQIPSNPSVIVPSLEGNTFSCRYFLQFTFIYKTPFCSTIKLIKKVPIKIISEADRKVEIIQLNN